FRTTGPTSAYENFVADLEHGCQIACHEIARGIEKTPKRLLKILGWAALLWILGLAKARNEVPISAVISAKRATQASTKNQRNLGRREAEGRLAASLLRYSPLWGCASLASCHPPF